MKKILSWILAIFMLLVSCPYDIESISPPVFAAESQKSERKIIGRLFADWNVDCRTGPEYQEILERILFPCGDRDRVTRGLRSLPGLAVQCRMVCWTKESSRQLAAARQEMAGMRAVRYIYFAHGL